MSISDGEPVRVCAEDLKRFVAEVMGKLGAPAEEARIVADVLVTADLRGVESHGVARFNRYVEAVEKGRIGPKAQIKVLSDWPALARLDGGNSLGQVVGYRAMERCLDMAEKAGAASVTVTNSTHYGIAAYYALMAVPRGMIGISMTNTAPHVAPTYGRAAMLGTNPIAMAVPVGSERPWVLDMATSAIAMGKAEVAQRAGKPLAKGLALDADGCPTCDTELVLRGEGTISPLGGMAETAGYKGYGLSVLVDILCGALSGAGYSAQIRPTWGSSSIGHYFAAIRIDAVRPQGDFEAMMAEMVRALRQAPKAAGQERIYTHGELEAEAQALRQREGIPLMPAVAQALWTLAERYGVANPLTLPAS